MKIMNKTISLLPVLFLLTAVIFAQTTGLPEPVRRGLTAFEKGDYQEALLQFRDVILDSSLETYHSDAYYWIGRSHLAMNDVEKAARNIDFFLAQYPNHRLAADAMYQKGRILYLQKEYEKAIRQLYTYIEKYPNHEYKPNGYFWIAESFYFLGHLDKAEAIYDLIVRDFPRSFKVEAASYRRSLIDLKKREQELLRLLKISHEEYLKALEEFQQREKEYEQAISSYQRKIAAAAGDGGEEDFLKELEDMNSQLSAAKQQISSLRSQLEAEKNRAAQLQKELENMPETVQAPPQQTAIPVAGGKEQTTQLLELKNTALTLKMFYIDWLQNNREDNS